jgi:two-component system cell cycle response regulator DivK
MKTGLVIEDNNDNMELITFILEQNGYETERAETGKRGLELVQEAPPDFVILDIQLPDMDGTEVLRKIRSTSIPLVPIIAMTSQAMVGDREKMLGAGCTGYIEKPIDPERVMTQITQIIGDA